MENKFLDLTGLNSLLNRISSAFARLVHTHDKSEIIDMNDDPVSQIVFNDRINSNYYTLEMRNGQLTASQNENV